MWVFVVIVVVEMYALSLCIEKKEDGPMPFTSSGSPLLIDVDSAILLQAIFLEYNHW